MEATTYSFEEVKRILDKVPSLKLPPKRLEPSLHAVADARGNRSIAVRNVLRNVFPSALGFTEKSSFRALVAPALTRLHLARSEPPYFLLAPNGRLWERIPARHQRAYLCLALRDFSEFHLGLPKHWLPPLGDLREISRPFGNLVLDRVGRLNNFLKTFNVDDQYWAKGSDYQILAMSPGRIKIKRGKHLTERGIGEFMDSLPERKMIAIDEVRFMLMSNLERVGVIASSFRVDKLLSEFLSSSGRDYAVIPGPYTRIDSLIIGNVPCNAVVRIGGGNQYVS